MKTLKGKIIAVVVVLVIAGIAYATGAGMLFMPQKASAAPVLYDQNTVSSIYDSVSPAVVEIDTTQQSTGFFSQFAEGQGSGFVVDANGNILTNNHVVNGASSLKVKFSNGNTVDGKVVGTDAVDDLAVVNVASSAVSGITPLKFSDSSAVKPGQLAIAIGNPFGLDNTITVGVISGLNRSVSGSDLRGMLQTDAAINPGNSGGPLLDINGTVIGINTAIEPPSTGARGIGFAVPSNVANNALPNLLAGKQVVRAWLGISGTSVTQSLAQQLKLSVNQGVYVVSVVSGGPADRAGLKAGNLDSNGNPVAGGDIITAIDGKNVATIDDLINYINTKNVGDNVTLSVLRNGATTSVQVTLGTRPSNPSQRNAPQSTPQPRTMPRIPGFPFRQFVPSN